MRESRGPLSPASLSYSAQLLFHIFLDGVMPVREHEIGGQLEHMIFQNAVGRTRGGSSVFLRRHIHNLCRLSGQAKHLSCEIRPAAATLAGGVEQSVILREQQRVDGLGRTPPYIVPLRLRARWRAFWRTTGTWWLLLPGITGGWES